MGKIAGVFLSVFLIAGAHLTAFAAQPQAVRSLHPDFADLLYNAELDGEPVDIKDLTGLVAYPGSVLEIFLTGDNADLFLDQNGKPVNTADVTASRLRAAAAAAYAEAGEGAGTVESVSLTVKNGGGPSSMPVITINFSNDYSGLRPINFSFDVYIAFHGENQPQSKLALSGSFGNMEIEVAGGEDAIIPDGAVVVALGDLPSVEIDAGYEIYVTASMTSGGRYRAVASPSSSRADLEILSLDSRLVDVILLDLNGFGEGDIKGIRIKTEENLYVYDENDEFVGMTEENLPARPKYLLATRQLED